MLNIHREKEDAVPPCLCVLTKGIMKISINNKETETAATNLQELADAMLLPAQGVAMALGTRMVQRTEWAATPLRDGDSVIIIKAACGG